MAGLVYRTLAFECLASPEPTEPKLEAIVANPHALPCTMTWGAPDLLCTQMPVCLSTGLMQS